MSVVGFDISFRVGGETDKGGVLRKLSLGFERAALESTRFDEHVWPGLLRAMEATEKSQFAAEGAGEVAGHWAPLTLKYEAWKAKHYPGAPINVRSGNMQAAFTNSTSPFAARAESSAELVFGTQGVPYASYAQDGTSRMVPRPPVDFGEDLVSLARREALKGLREAMKTGLGPYWDVADDSKGWDG